MDVVTIMLTAACTGVGVSIGNALYEFLLKDYLHGLLDKKKKIENKIVYAVKEDIENIRKIGDNVNRDREKEG